MIDPYQKLFTTVLRWQKAEKKIMDGAFLDLNAEETQAEVDEFGRELYKLVKSFTAKSKAKKKDRDLGGGVRRADAGKMEQSANPPPLRMATGTLEHIKDFKVWKPSFVGYLRMFYTVCMYVYTHPHTPLHPPSLTPPLPLPPLAGGPSHSPCAVQPRPPPAPLGQVLSHHGGEHLPRQQHHAEEDAQE